MQLRSRQDGGLHLPGVGFRILRLSAYKGFIPTQHLHGGAGVRAQGSHHRFRRREVSLVIDGQDHSVGHFPGRNA